MLIHQADEGERIGGDAGERQTIHDAIKKPAASAAKSAGPGHSNLPCYCSLPGPAFVFFRFVRARFIVNRGQLQNFEFALAVGRDMVATSPTRLPTRPRPIGEVVEIRPLETSDSSLVTRR